MLKVLVCRTGAFGDVCMALPLIDALGAQTDVHWLIRSGLESVLTLFPRVRCRPIAVEFDARRAFPTPLIAELGNAGYDALVDLSNWPSGAILARRLKRIPIRAISYDRTRPWLPQRLTNALPWFKPFNCVINIDGKVHRAVRWQRLIEDSLDLRVSIDWPLRSIARVADPIRLFVHPHASKPNKSWPIENFVDAITQVSAHRRMTCAVNDGIAHERVQAEQLASELRAAGLEVVRVSHDPSFTALRDALLQADLAVGPEHHRW